MTKDLKGDFRVETTSLTGVVTSGEPVLDEDTAKQWAAKSNMEWGKEGFHSVVKRGPKPPEV